MDYRNILALDTAYLNKLGRYDENIKWEEMYNLVKDSDYQIVIPRSYIPEVSKLSDSTQQEKILTILDGLSKGLLYKDSCELSINELASLICKEEIKIDLSLDMNTTCQLDEIDIYKNNIGIKGIRLLDIMRYTDKLIPIWKEEDAKYAEGEKIIKQFINNHPKVKDNLRLYFFKDYYKKIREDIIETIRSNLSICLKRTDLVRITESPLNNWDSYYENSFYTKAWIDLLDYYFRTDLSKKANIQDRYDMEFNFHGLTSSSIMASDKHNINKLKQSGLLEQYTNPTPISTVNELVEELRNKSKS